MGTKGHDEEERGLTVLLIDVIREDTANCHCLLGTLQTFFSLAVFSIGLRENELSSPLVYCFLQFSWYTKEGF